MNPKLSIIVPVYHVEEYLRECIESLINQTFKDYEIILVDDGSADRCPEICDFYASEYENIIVIHKINEGLSSARNAGLDIARGEFVTFIDSDDYVEQDMYQFLIDNIESNDADVAICGRYYLYGEKRVIKSLQNIRVVMDGAKAVAMMNINIVGYYDVAAWDKVYRRSLFENIRFPVGKLSEDWYTTYKVLDRARRVVYDSEPKYIYRQREKSITHSRKVNYEPLEASREVLDFVKKKHPEYVKEAEVAHVYAGIGVIDNLIEQKNIDRQEILSVRKKLKPYLETALKYPKLRGKRKIQLFLVKNCINIYILIFEKIKAIS